MYYFLEAAGTANAAGSGIMTIVMLVAMVAIFYFFMYRPQKKQEKETNNMRNNLQVGDEITTIGGIIGKITSPLILYQDEENTVYTEVMQRILDEGKFPEEYYIQNKRKETV